MMFKFPDGTKQRIQSLSQPHESMTNVMLRAINLLERSIDQSIPINTELESTESISVNTRIDSIEASMTQIDKMFEDVLNQLAAMQASFAAFEVRLSAIEAGAVSELTSVKEVSLDVRLVAVAMKAAKKTNEEIQAYIGNATGKRFSFSFKQNLSNNLENWKRAADKQL
ncbi:hypothetical protein [Chromatium okenii]|jgi:hypothetical protein|nr:hypothetical protein [Chromatium okenii]